MHIVQVANFVTATSGGQRHALNSLASEYIALGHRCTIVFPGQQSRLSNDGSRDCIQVAGVLVPLSGGYRAILAREELKKVLTNLQPDVVELSDKTTLSWVPEFCRKMNVPCVLFSHERAADVVSERLPRLLPVAPVFNTWAKRITENISAVICASNYASDEYRHIAERVHKVQLGVDHSVFNASASRQGRTATPTVMFAGRLSPEKRPYLAVAAARHLQLQGHKVKFVIAGDGPMRRHLEATSEGLDVEFVGRVSDREALAQMMASATVTVAPGPFETFGLSILESLACGTPVVVSDRGAGQELIEGGCGAVAAHDGAAIAAALLQLFDEDQIAMRIRCVERASNLSWSKSAAKMLAIFGSLSDQTLAVAA